MAAEHKASVLIVDDNASQRETMSVILRHKGYAVATARDGREAIERVQQGPFDMIFMDIKMPLLNGLDSYRRIKAIRPDAMVMMMTAYAVEHLIQQALEEGAYGIVYKPLDMDRAIAIIEQAVRSKKGALILVVDDDPATCITLEDILTRRGCQVASAHTGKEAIALARETTYDVLLIDMKLPVLSGLETYLVIREINPEAVAIIMTGYWQEMAELVEEALRSHAHACLHKPLDIEKLVRLVEGIWQNKRKAGSLGDSL